MGGRQKKQVIEKCINAPAQGRIKCYNRKIKNRQKTSLIAKINLTAFEMKNNSLKVKKILESLECERYTVRVEQKKEHYHRFKEKYKYESI